MIKIIIPGEPVPKGRGRVGRNKATGRPVVYTPAATVEAEGGVQWAAWHAMAGRSPLVGALSVEITCYRSKGMPGNPNGKQGSKGRLRWLAALAGRLLPTTKPDLDNYVKTVLDGCNGVVWRDDSQICKLVASKLYSDRPRIEVVVTEIGGVDDDQP